MAEFTVAKVGEIAQGGRKIVNIGGTLIAIFNLAGKYHVIENVCPHQGGPVGEGKIFDGDVVECPLHAWRFNIKTGQHAEFSGVGVKIFSVKVAGDEIKIVID